MINSTPCCTCDGCCDDDLGCIHQYCEQHLCFKPAQAQKKGEEDANWDAYEAFWSTAVKNKQAHPRATWEAAWNASKAYFTEKQK